MYKEKKKATDGTTKARKEKQPCLTKCSMLKSQQTRKSNISTMNRKSFGRENKP